jgi:hypothetical protein
MWSALSRSEEIDPFDPEQLRARIVEPCGEPQLERRSNEDVGGGLRARQQEAALERRDFDEAGRDVYAGLSGGNDKGLMVSSKTNPPPGGSVVSAVGLVALEANGGPSIRFLIGVSGACAAPMPSKTPSWTREPIRSTGMNAWKSAPASERSRALSA